MQSPPANPSLEQSRKQWTIPKSYGLGFNPGYFNILRGNEWIAAYVRENFGLHDSASFVQEFYDKGEQFTQNCRPEERPRISHEYLRDMVLGLPITKSLAAQLVQQLTQIAGRNYGPVDLVRAKAFFAYCGIDGLYDLETGKHHQVPRRLAAPPYTLLRSRWLDADPEECERYRLHMVELMCKEEVDEFKKVLDARYKAIRDPVSAVTGPVLQARYESGEPPFETTQKRIEWEKEHFPQFAEQIDQALRVDDDLEPFLKKLKDKWAPMDPDFEYPPVGSAFDLDWQEHNDAMLRRPEPWTERWNAHMEAKGTPVGHPDHKPFRLDELRARCAWVQDYALRDFTMSPINRGSNVHYRNLDIPHDFVKAVKREMEDGMLGVLKPPHRIEPLNDGTDRWQFIVYGAEAGTFSLQDVYDLEASLAPDDRVAKPAQSATQGAQGAALVPGSALSASPASPAAKLPDDELMSNAKAKLAMVMKNGLLDDGGIIKSQIHKRLCDELFEFNKLVTAAGLTLLTAPQLNQLTKIIDLEHKRVADIERKIARERKSSPKEGVYEPGSLNAAKHAHDANASAKGTRGPGEQAPIAERVALPARSPDTALKAKNRPNPDESAEDNARRDRSKKAVRDAVQTISQAKASRGGPPRQFDSQSGSGKELAQAYGQRGGQQGKREPTEEELRERLARAQDAAQSMGSMSAPVIDFGIGSLARSWMPGRNKTNAAPANARSSTHTRADTKADNRLDEVIARTHELRESTARLSRKPGPDSMPLSLQARIAEWANMTDTLTKLDTLVTDLKQAPTEHKEKLLEVLSESKEVAEKAEAVIDQHVDKPGEEGEGARKAKEACEKFVEMIKAFIDTILILLGLKKRPNKNGQALESAPVCN